MSLYIKIIAYVIKRHNLAGCILFFFLPKVKCHMSYELKYI